MSIQRNSSLKYANSFDIGRKAAAQIVENILNFNFLENEKTDKQKAFRVNLEKETCVVGKLHDGYHYFYAYTPQFVLNKTDCDKVQCLESVGENELSFIVFDSSGFLREILYYGKAWKSEWIECSNLINIHSSFLTSIQNEFGKNEDEFVNICELFDQKQYRIMSDDRFKDWMRKVENLENGDLDKIKEEIKEIINCIANTNEE